MGKPLPKIVSSIRNPILAHAPTDDSRLEPEYIEDMVLDVRATLIKEFYTSNYYLDDSFFQVYDGIEIQSEKVTVPAGVQDDFPELFAKIPALQSHVGFKNIRYFGSIDGRYNFTRKSMSGFISTEGLLFTMNEPVYTVSGTKVQLKNLPNLGMKYGRLIAVFYDPRLIPGFNEDEDFPVSDGMIHKLEIICKKNIMSSMGIPPDIINDAQDVIIDTTKKNDRRSN